MNLPTTTQVISTVGKHWLNFDAVPPEVLERACARGQDFHRLAALHVQNLWIDEIPNSCIGFFKSFSDWFKDFVEETIMSEQMLVHPTLGYTGTPDIIVRIKGDKGNCLIDHKTPRALSRSWRLQISSYCELARANGYQVERVASLQPHPDGGRAKFTGYTKSLAADWNVFRSMLNVWRFFDGK